MAGFRRVKMGVDMLLSRKLPEGPPGASKQNIVLISVIVTTLFLFDILQGFYKASESWVWLGFVFALNNVYPFNLKTNRPLAILDDFGGD